MCKEMRECPIYTKGYEYFRYDNITATKQQAWKKREKRNPNHKEKRKPDHKTNEEQFEWHHWSYAFSGTFNSNMYEIDHLSQRPHWLLKQKHQEKKWFWFKPGEYEDELLESYKLHQHAMRKSIDCRSWKNSYCTVHDGPDLQCPHSCSVGSKQYLS